MFVRVRDSKQFGIGIEIQNSSGSGLAHSELFFGIGIDNHDRKSIYRSIVSIFEKNIAVFVVQDPKLIQNDMHMVIRGVRVPRCQPVPVLGYRRRYRYLAGTSLWCTICRFLLSFSSRYKGVYSVQFVDFWVHFRLFLKNIFNKN